MRRRSSRDPLVAGWSFAHPLLVLVATAASALASTECSATHSATSLTRASVAVAYAGRGTGVSGSSIRWRKTRIDARFRSEGIAALDVDRDGLLDLVAGELWYRAPAWEPQEVDTPLVYDAANGYSQTFREYAMDVDRDGWTDVILLGLPGTAPAWIANPRGKPGLWSGYVIRDVARNETSAFIDIDRDGRPDLVFPDGTGRMNWYEPGPDATAPFVAHSISGDSDPMQAEFEHGMGAGDVDGDGRVDVLARRGFWSAPPDPRAGPWPFVPADLGADCAEMRVYDVDGDGLADVVTSSAHAAGVWWFQQTKTPAGPVFRRHLIDESFSQSHALDVADINGDGLLDLITGKRFWAHGPHGDLDPNAPALLVWYELRRDHAGPRYVRHVIDDDSGIGTQFQVVDVDGDGLLDVAVSNKRGVFLFEQRRD